MLECGHSVVVPLLYGSPFFRDCNLLKFPYLGQVHAGNPYDINA